MKLRIVNEPYGKYTVEKLNEYERMERVETGTFLLVSRYVTKVILIRNWEKMTELGDYSYGQHVPRIEFDNIEDAEKFVEWLKKDKVIKEYEI